MEATLLLEDGTILKGLSFGASGTVLGELVFNTGMTGYQEILTDPSYAGQVVTMTYPLVGNYGVNVTDIESNKVQVSGFVVKEATEVPSHWQSEDSLSEYLIKNNIIGISKLDTRMLTKKIRNKGTMTCLLTTEELSDAHYAALKSYVFPSDIVAQVSISENVVFEGSGKHVGIVDLGLKKGITDQLLKLGCKVTIYPHDVKAAEIQAANLDALLLSNGPGDPKDALSAIELAQTLIGTMPIWGICLGHQILALAMGADTYKLKFGHRGSNHPILELTTGKVYISSQNHGYAVDPKSLTEGMAITHINVNDETVEGISNLAANVRCVQFHPEEGPGPEDAHYLFKQWVETL